MELELKLSNSKETLKIFEALPAEFQKRVLTTAAKGGASVIRKAARANLKRNGSVRTGLLVRSINLSVKAYRSGIVWAGVGADRSVSGRTAEGKNILPWKYIHLVETGTSRVGPKPFLRPAADNNRAAIQSAFVKAADKGLAREIKKLKARFMKNG